MATIMKLSRVLMLVFAAIIIAIWWDRTHSTVKHEGKRKVAFPWFMLGFIAASVLGTYVPFLTAISAQLVDVAYIVLGMAMAALPSWWTWPTSCSAWPWPRSAST